ncbi:MAG: DUF6522 family protein [Pseudomonadota bacterium]
MNAPSPAPVEIAGDDVTIDAEVLAPKLGLSVADLKTHMARGDVLSVVEAGQEEDAGRTRLTFRYRARIWRVVVEADGSLTDDPMQPARPAGATSLFDLHHMARNAGTTEPSAT